MFVSFYFIIGFLSGLYVGQEYKVPKIKYHLKELEKIILKVVKNIRIKELAEMKDSQQEETGDIDVSIESEEEDTVELETEAGEKED